MIIDISEQSYQRIHNSLTVLVIQYEMLKDCYQGTNTGKHYDKLAKKIDETMKELKRANYKGQLRS